MEDKSLKIVKIGKISSDWLGCWTVEYINNQIFTFLLYTLSVIRNRSECQLLDQSGTGTKTLSTSTVHIW